ncbi:MAG TPA: DoxX family protein [Methylophaga aminisulfidivorans]|uniref:DoxX family protein n=1 Tax=Methylophaga aminisulfidivorans TaxID=230105 RepID=A0A7C1W654_9GAMM|nr:DoxX family protein [Methylophaga aminisulfidivorans]
MNALTGLITVTGRFMLSFLFIAAGIGKLGAGYAATEGYMAMMGVPSWLLPIVIATEIGGGLAILLGFKTRVVAFLMAGFTLLTAIIFHSNLADQTQSIMFMKNLSIAGGLLLLTVNGAGRYALDNRH